MVFSFFSFGYLLLTNSKAYFTVLDKIRAPVTIITPMPTVIFLAVSRRELRQRFGFSVPETLWILIQAYHAWFWCLLLFSWAANLLNRPSRALTYLNQAIYPIFIVHQYLTYLIVFLLTTLAIFSPFKDLILGPILVLSSAFLIFEIIKRARFARVAFGIKPLPLQQNLELRTGGRIGRAILFHILTIIIIILLNWGNLIHWGWEIGNYCGSLGNQF